MMLVFSFKSPKIFQNKNMINHKSQHINKKITKFNGKTANKSRNIFYEFTILNSLYCITVKDFEILVNNTAKG